jgi:hypothetical protein
MFLANCLTTGPGLSFVTQFFRYGVLCLRGHVLCVCARGVCCAGVCVRARVRVYACACASVCVHACGGVHV